MIKNKSFQIVLKSTKTTLRIAANCLYAVMFIILTIYSFLNTTQFDMSWTRLLMEAQGWEHVLYVALFSPHVLLIPIILLQYLCSDEYDWKDYVLAVVLGGLAYYVFTRNESSALLSYVLLAVGARKIPFQRLMQLYFIVAAGSFLWTVTGSQMGWVENLVYEEGSNAFGFIYSTDCGAHILFLALAYLCIRGERIHYIEAAGFAGLGVFAWVGCRARFSTLLLLLLAVTVCILRFLRKKMGTEEWNRIFSGIPSAILAAVPLLCSIGTHLLSMIYSKNSKILSFLNSVVSGRISLVKRGIDVYGFRLFGSNIPMVGGGGAGQQSKYYYYIDSSYMQISLLYGLIALGIILLLFTIACMSARQAENWMLLIILTFVALHAIFEHHAFELAYSPFLFAAFADPARKKKSKAEKRRDENDEDRI